MQKIKNKLYIIFGIYFTFGWLVANPLSAEEVKEASQTAKSIKLSLSDVTQLALRNNLDIQIARYTAYAQRTDLTEAESVFDTVLNASASYSDDQSKTATAFAGTRSTINEYGLGLSKKLPTGTTLGLEFSDTRASTNSAFTSLTPAHEATARFSIHQPLGSNIFGLIDRGQIRITRLDVLNSDFSALGRIEESLAQAQIAYWRLALAYRELKVGREMLNKAKSLYENFLKKNKLGLVEDAELFAAKANVLQRQNNVQTLAHQLLLAKNNLLLYLHEEDLDLEVIPQDVFMPAGQNIEVGSSLKIAIKNNRDYQQAVNELQSRGINFDIKKNSLWPEIDLELSFAQNGLELEQSKAWQNVTAEDNPELFLGMSVTLDLENKKARSAKEKAQIEKANALLKLKKIEHKIVVDVTNSVDTINNKRESIKLNKNIVDLQEKKLNFEEKRFASGRSSSDTLIRYQEDLLQAKLLLAQSLFGYEQAQIDLKLAEDSLLNEFWQGAL